MVWQKGQSGNPRGGKRKALSVTAALRAYAESVDEEDGRTRAEKLADRLWDLADSSDETVALNAVRYIFERLDGKVPDALSVNQSGKLTVEVVRVAGRAKSQD